MYDTFKAYLGADAIIDRDGLLNSLSGLEEVYSRKLDAYRFRGHHRNLFVTVSIRGISVNGSLCKWYHGNNLQGLTMQDTQRAIQDLSEALRVPIASAKVSQLHLSANLLMQHPTSVYFRLIGQAPGKRRMQRITQRYGVELRNNTCMYQFYDKLKEMKMKDEPIPPGMIGKHVLRFEVKYNRNMKQKIGYNELNLGKLGEPETYGRMVNLWESAFNEIEMQHEEVIPFDHAGDVKTFQALLMAKGIESLGGLDVVLNEIEAANKKGQFAHRKIATRLKGKAREVNKLRFGLVPNEEVSELHAKIEATARKYRQCL